MPLRILLVDDNPDDRTLATRELHNAFPDAQIHAIGDRAAMETALAEGDFDVLITDYLLRWADGVEVIRAAKHRYPDRPVIMFTSSGNEEVAVEAMKAGLDDYILKKPSYFARLPIAVRSVVEHAHARREAAEALRSRERFLDIAAHELRTPLTTIAITTQMVQQRIETLLARATAGGANGDGEPVTQVDLHPVQRLLERAQREIGRLGRFVDDLTDATRLQRDELTFQLVDVDLRSVVEEAVDVQRAIEPKRTIVLRQPERRILTRIDPDRIAQVITNFLDNAWKFTFPDVPITVEIQAQDGRARVAIYDEGPGLAAEELERVWEPFYRVEGVAHRSGSSIGLGLGLSVARAIVGRHGGQVGVESAPGKGSTFWFTLPLLDGGETTGQ